MVRSTVAKAKTTKKSSVERHRSTRAPAGLPKNPVVDSNKAEFAVVSDPAVPAPPPLAGMSLPSSLISFFVRSCSHYCFTVLFPLIFQKETAQFHL
jgi:hypothetical protein